MPVLDAYIYKTIFGIISRDGPQSLSWADEGLESIMTR